MLVGLHVCLDMPTKGSPKSYTSTSVGIGAGYSIGTDAMFKVTNNSEK